MSDTSYPGDAALALLKQYEQGPHGGFAPVVYVCPAGHKTIGWGHRVQPGERFAQPISAAEADQMLIADLRRIYDQIRPAIRVPLTQSMMDALGCFAFNLGPGAFLGSTLRNRLNAGNYAGSADEFLRWNKAINKKTGKMEVLSGLTRRRQAERELFLRDGLPG